MAYLVYTSDGYHVGKFLGIWTDRQDAEKCVGKHHDAHIEEVPLNQPVDLERLDGYMVSVKMSLDAIPRVSIVDADTDTSELNCFRPREGRCAEGQFSLQRGSREIKRVGFLICLAARNPKEAKEIALGYWEEGFEEAKRKFETEAIAAGFVYQCSTCGTYHRGEREKVRLGHCRGVCGRNTVVKLGRSMEVVR